MFKGLKEKLLDVSKNVGLLKEVPENSQIQSLDHNAGTKLLTHFQQQWVELHDLNEQNANNADEISVEISNINEILNKNKLAFVQLSILLTSVPNLKESIDCCMNRISSLYDSFEHVEKDLINLEDVIEQLELNAVKTRNLRQLHVYEKHKLDELETKRLSLSAKYVQSACENELNRKKILQEKQQLYQAAFEVDLETYKKLGVLPRKENANNSSALLEEIHLEYDQQELDQFFKD